MRKENTNSVISSLYFLLIDSFGVQNLYVVKTDSLGSVTTELFEVGNLFSIDTVIFENVGFFFNALPFSYHGQKHLTFYIFAILFLILFQI